MNILGPGEAHAVNNLGQVAGYSYYGGYWATIWSPNGTLFSPIGTTTVAYGINDSGTAAGNYTFFENGNFASRPFVWNAGGGMQLIGPAGVNNFATAINNSGWITGYTNNSAFLYDGISFQSLATPAGYSSSGGYVIGNDGAVYGVASSGATGSMVVWRNGQPSLIPGLEGGSGFPEGVNSSGVLVGSSRLSSGLLQAFLWDGTQTINLADYIANVTGMLLVEATGINDAGQIIGRGLLGGVDHAVLLTPTDEPRTFAPEPGAWILVSAGLVVLVRRRRR